jgi:hypothetical protein
MAWLSVIGLITGKKGELPLARKGRREISGWQPHWREHRIEGQVRGGRQPAPVLTNWI